MDLVPCNVLICPFILVFSSFSTVLFISKKSTINILSQSSIELLVCIDIKTFASLNLPSSIKGNILLKAKGKPFKGSILPTPWTCVMYYWITAI